MSPKSSIWRVIARATPRTVRNWFGEAGDRFRNKLKDVAERSQESAQEYELHERAAELADASIKGARGRLAQPGYDADLAAQQSETEKANRVHIEQLRAAEVRKAKAEADEAEAKAQSAWATARKDLADAQVAANEAADVLLERLESIGVALVVKPDGSMDVLSTADLGAPADALGQLAERSDEHGDVIDEE